MKKTFKIVDLDCAHCAAKMEEAIKKIDGVEDAKLSFMSLRLTVTAPDDIFDNVMKEAVKVCSKIEPDCTIVM